MADENIGDMTELSGSDTGDYLVIVDISDPTDAPSGTTKRITIANLSKAFASTFGLTILDDAANTNVLTTLGIDNDALTLALPASTTISAYGKTLVDDADAETAVKTLNIRNSTLKIEENDAADGQLKCTFTSVWNGDTIAVQDNVNNDGVPTGNFSLSIGRTTFRVHEEGLSGACVTVLDASIVSNDTTTDVNVLALMNASDIYVIFYHLTAGTAVDMEAMVAAGGGNKTVEVNITYVTDA
jgi:hypothetical protein